MRLTSLAKVCVGITALALVAGAATLPAAADPTNPDSGTAFGKLVGVGSDTTQDVMNGIANALGGPASNPIIASYDATVHAAIQTRSGGPLIDRPNGSGDGAAALLTSIGQSASGAWKTYVATGTPTQLEAGNDTTTGQVDFSRSSSGPGANAVAGGVVTYVPFATDALDYATDPTSAFSAFPNGLTVAQLKLIYGGSVNAILTGGAGDPQLIDDTSATPYTPQDGEVETPIHVYVPQAGSGTRKFWLGTFLGIADSGTTVDHFSTSPISDVAVSGLYGSTEASVLTDPTDPTSTTPVEEHDGSVLEGDDGAIMPFSIGKWVADNNGLATNNTHGAILGTVNDAGVGVSATTQTDSTYALNADYVSDFGTSNLTRLVYNVIPTREISDPRSVTRWAFVGPNSLVCQESTVIASYGFQPLSTTVAGPNECGDTSRTAYLPSTATVVVAPSATSIGYGSTYNATATVTSVGNGGGTVDFKIGDRVVDTETLPAGPTSDAHETVTANGLSATGFTPGTWSLTAVFHPNLEGVQNGAVSPASTFAVTTLASTVTVIDPSMSHHIAPVVEVTVTAPSGIVPTGVVSIKTSSKTLKSKVTLIDGMATITLPKYSSKGKHTLYVEYYGDSDVNPTKSFKFTYTAS